MAALAGPRRWLAQILCPEAFKAEDRLDYIRVRLSELEQWCGYGFPEIAAAVDWIQRSERVHFMAFRIVACNLPPSMLFSFRI